MRTIWPCLALLTCLSAALAEPDDLDRGLAAIGLTRAQCGLDLDALRLRGCEEGRLLLFDEWVSHPLRIPFWERHLRDTLLASRGNTHVLTDQAVYLLGTRTWRELSVPTPARSYLDRGQAPNALRAALLALDPQAKVPSVEGLPERVPQMAAAILFSLADALTWREMALRRLSLAEREALYAGLVEPIERPTTGRTPEEMPFPAEIEGFSRQHDALLAIDYPLFYSATDDLTALLEVLCADLAKTPVTGTFAFTCATRWGEVRLSGGTDDYYSAKNHPLLILDTSGDDTYRAGGASGGPTQPLGVVIDAAGNDRYRSDEAPAFGVGVMGWGLLYDLAGDDAYSTKGFYSQGVGLAGVGILQDASGTDTYRAFGGAQGVGYYGMGILADLAGNDAYDTYVYSQGCGMPRGVGLLLDLTGDDTYTANDTDILFPSSQTKEHNSSMSQGAGFGFRRDYLDARPVAGGLGMLLDGAGNDRYFGGVFSQAVAYMYGLGVLDDRAGNDTYRGVWYAQSATAHFAVSYQTDGGGDDTYAVTNCVSNGSAHDYSVSVFLEEAGDDTYEMRGSALGQGLNNGMGLFVDLLGNDTYRCGLGNSYGQSVNFTPAGLRAEISTLGVFLDLDGADAYPGAPPGNNHLWTQPARTPLPLLRGVGLDTTGGTLRWD